MFGRRGETDMAVNGVARSERSGLSGQVRVGEFRLEDFSRRNASLWARSANKLLSFRPPARRSRHAESALGEMSSEADEVAALKKMFKSPTKSGTIPIHRRPAWDSTPLRGRPPQLVGLKPVTREPWAIDEDVYNRRFETRDVGVRE